MDSAWGPCQSHQQQKDEFHVKSTTNKIMFAWNPSRFHVTQSTFSIQSYRFYIEILWKMFRKFHTWIPYSGNCVEMFAILQLGKHLLPNIITSTFLWHNRQHGWASNFCQIQSCLHFCGTIDDMIGQTTLAKYSQWKRFAQDHRKCFWHVQLLRFTFWDGKINSVQ